MADSLVIYVGDSTFQERSDPVFSTNGYELDTARWPWSGATPLKVEFENGLQKFQPMGQAFPRMFLAGTSDDGGNNVTTIDLNYVGFRGVLPPPKSETSQITQAFSFVSPGVEPFLGDASWQAQYYAPRTTWTWYTANAPNPITPTYSTIVGGISPASTLFNVRGTSPAIAIAIARKIPTRTTISDYKYTPVVPGNVWSCSCTVDLNFYLP